MPGSPKRSEARGSPGLIPAISSTIKYKTYSALKQDPALGSKKHPSQHRAEQQHPSTHADGWRPKPEIVELLNIADYSHQAACAVDVDEPVFQPFPPQVAFHAFEPFEPCESLLYLRNNDQVARRVKVEAPTCPVLTVRRVHGSHDEGSKVAAGMEVVYQITFTPEAPEDFRYDLVVTTERERFLVPVLAQGHRAALDLPDLLDFGTTPCKSGANRTLLVTNVGRAPAALALQATDPFSVSPSHARLAPGDALRMTVDFHPRTAGEHDGELEVMFDHGDVVYVDLVGTGTETDVQLTPSALTLLPTYIGMQTQATAVITNGSATPVTFAFKRFASPAEEYDDATLAVTSVALQASRLDVPPALLTASSEAASSSAGSADEEGASNELTAVQAHVLGLQHSSIDADQHLFCSSSYQIEPIQGTVWPGMRAEITVTLRPDHGQEYQATAFCEVQGRSERLPLRLRGRGLGPQVVLGYDVLDVGDAFINTPHKYTVELMNRGEIDARFRLLPNPSLFASKFTLEPAAGVLRVGETLPISVQLLSDLLGSFDETFEWALEGTSTTLRLQFRGRVGGPLYKVSSELLDFGIVSVGFRYALEFEVHNACAIPMRYAWRVPQDLGEPREFQVLPASGTVLPMGRQQVTVEFLPRDIQHYQAHALVLDIPTVGEALHSVPIRAECVVPMVSLGEHLDYEHCFLRHPYVRTLTLTNTSKLPSKFEVLPQEPLSKGLALISAEPQAGSIAALGSQTLQVTLRTARLGRIQLPLRVKVLGSRRGPLQCIVGARSIGPILEFGSELAGMTTKPEVAFGSVEVLQEKEAVLAVHNPSQIAAAFKTFIEGQDSPFAVTPREGHLEPGERMQLRLTVTLDEARAHRDLLHIFVKEGDDITVPLTATGTGQVVICPAIAGGIDFGHQFTGRRFVQLHTIQNQGKQPATLSWSNATQAAAKAKLSKAVKKDTGPPKQGEAPPAELVPIYTITPDRCVIPAKGSCEIEVAGLAPAAGIAEEHLVCSAGGGGKTRQAVFDIITRAEVAVPALDFSERRLAFAYSYCRGVPALRMSQPLTIRNVSALPLSFHLRTGSPFSLDRLSGQLTPGEGVAVLVSFDPASKTDLVSAVLRRKLSVAYGSGSQVDLDLVGEVNFPNLKFDQPQIDFGSVLNDTTARMAVPVTNVSKVDAVYHWVFAEGHEPERLESARSSRAPAGARAFDILPTRGVLPAGTTEAIEFAYYAAPSQRAAVVAVCEVEGGPTYSLPLAAESNAIKFAVEPQQIDVGVVLLDRATESQLVVRNQGRVPFEFRVLTSWLSRPGVIECSPEHATVAAGQHMTVKLKIVLGVPERVTELLKVEIAHFEPLPISVAGEGIFPAVALTLPRAHDDAFEAAVANLQEQHVQTSAGLRSRSASPVKMGDRGSRSEHGDKRPASDLTPKIRLEAEADRLLLTRRLLDRGTSPRPAALPGTLDRAADENKPGTANSSRSTILGMGIVSAQYILEFGYVIKGASKARKFKVVSTGAEEATFEMDRKLLARSGFAVSQDRPITLAGAPEHASIEIMITLQTGRLSARPGPLTLDLPITLKGGPTVMVALRAVLVTPEVRLSSEALAFGPVPTGKCKVMMVAMHNPREVAAEWQVKAPLEAGGAKDWAFFKAEPEQGTLAPGQRMLLKVLFTPSPAHEAAYSQRLLLKVNFNAKGPVIACTAAGFTPRVTFEPPVLDLAPIRPSFEGQRPNEAVVWLCNGSSIDVEAYSLDWDKRYLEDEAKLRAAGGYGPGDVMMLEPLVPGGGFWSDLPQPPAPEAAEDPSPAAGNPSMAPGAAPSLPTTVAAGDAAEVVPGATAPDRLASQPSLLPGAGIESEAAAGPLVPGGVNLVVLGPPQAGKSTQAALLATRYNLPCSTADGLIMAAAQMEAENEDAAGADELFDKLIGKPVDQQAKGHVPAHAQLQPAELEALLTRAFKAVLGAAEYSAGVVVDGLDSQYADAPVISACLLAGFGLTKQLHPEAMPAPAPPPPAKGKKAEPLPPQPPPDPTAFHWEGARKVTFVALTMAPESVAARYREAQVVQAEPQPVPPSGKPVTPPRPTRSVSEKGRPARAPAAKPKTPARAAKGVKAQTPPAMQPPAAEAGAGALAAEPAPAAALGQPGAEAAPAQPAPGDAEAAAARQQQDAALQGLVQAAQQWPASLQQLWEAALGKQTQEACVEVLQVQVEGGDATQVLHKVCGISFRQGVFSTRLPPVPADQGLVPEPYLLQIVKRPKQRPERRPVNVFKLMTPQGVEGIQGSTPEALAALQACQQAEQSRWVIPARGAIPVLVQFQSPATGSFSEQLAFEVVGVEGRAVLPVSGTCDYPRVASQPGKVFARRSRQRPDSAHVSRQFVASTGQFEFGPLLMGVDSAGYLEGRHAGNATKLRITNTGLFELHCNFCCKSQPAEALPEAGAGKKAASKGKDAPKEAPVFVFEPKAMDLKLHETQELTLWAFPQAPGPVQDTLVCRVSDNPTPVEFALSCVGAKPEVQVRLAEGASRGPTPLPGEAGPGGKPATPVTPSGSRGGKSPPPPAAPSPPPAAPAAAPKAAVKGKKEEPAAAPPRSLTPQSKLLQEGIAFERLLLGKVSSKAFIIRNISLLPCTWKLAGAEKLPAEFRVVPASGELPAREEVQVAVEFAAKDKRVLAEKLVLQVSDAGGLQGTVQDIPLTLSAEAYQIEVQLKLPVAGAAGLDFGLIKASEDARRTVTLVNSGKYAATCRFQLRGATAKELFVVTPAEATLPAGGQQAVEVHFNKERALRREVTLADSSDISVAVIEPATGRKEATLPLKVSLRAAFSKYALTPAHGINFGPVTYNTATHSRAFEVANLGEFPLTVKAFNLAEGQAAATPAPAPAAAAKGGKKDAAPADVGLVLGKFNVQPSVAVVAPGSKQAVTVTFKAEGDEAYIERLGLDITDREPADSPAGIPYELTGESVIPGIDAANLEAIFEEHVVVPRLDRRSAAGSQYGRDERAFDFGAVLAAVAADGGGSAEGVKANLKFVNPTKVQAIVNFAVKPLGAAVAGVFPLQAVPAQLVLPPNEARYMSLMFKPTAIRTYAASFEANVEGGSKPATMAFACELRGEGTLPSLSLEMPGADKGAPAVKFGRLLKGRRASLAVTLRNNGMLPATARIAMEPHPAFGLVGGKRAVTLESKHAQQVVLEFVADEVKQHSHEVMLEVQQNPFERHRVPISAECYLDPLVLEGLPGDAVDELRLGDTALGLPVQATFMLHNLSQRHYRFEWPAVPNLTINPSIGHLAAGAVRDITATFQSAAPSSLKAQPVAVKATELKLPAGAAPSEWDNRRREGASAPEAEPKVELITGKGVEQPTVVLKVSAVADTVACECDQAPIAFRPTVMFQTRIFTFPLKNTSAAHLDFQWAVLLPDGQPDTSGLYQVTPEAGSLAANEVASVSVRFSPQEVVDCSRVLAASISGLAAGQQPPRRALSGGVLRPWCHFDLPVSDYLTGGRRTSDRRGPTGDLGPLDSATKVLEVESLGVKVRNVKRFWLLNPTSRAYEFRWDPFAAPGAAPADSPFRCVTAAGMVAAGMRHEMVFEYTPASDELQESFWHFRVPELRLDVPFLVVGQVSEPRVAFDRSSLSFGRVLVGGRTHAVVKLVNHEALPFEWQLDKASYDALETVVESTGRRPTVSFEPSAGRLLPGSSATITATYHPRTETASNYNVICLVKRKPTRLLLNVKGEGYAVHSSLQMEAADGSVLELSPEVPNNIDFGQVLVNDRQVRALSLVNSGSLKIDYVWRIGNNPRIEVAPAAGSVGCGDRAACMLSFSPHSALTLHGHRVQCQVANGPTYTLLLSGVGHKPALDFSFLKHSFGRCFVHQPGMHAQQARLVLRNNDPAELNFSLDWEDTADLQVASPTTMLQPGASCEVLITFTPQTPGPHSLAIPFNINGLYVVRVAASGEAAPMQLALANPAQHHLNLGAVPAGGQASKVVQVVNGSRITCTLALGASAARLAAYGVEVQPAELLVHGKERVGLTFLYRPPHRLRAWKEQVSAEVAGVTVPLLTVAGACLGVEVKLAAESVPFGLVVLGSKASKLLQLENTGDIGAKFAFDRAALGAAFSIYPTEGFLAPGQDVKLEVTFQPKAVDADIRVEKVRCRIEGGADCFLTLTGACGPARPEAAPIAFRCPVRGSTTQEVTVANSTVTAWQLAPVVEHESWSGPEVLSVPAQGRASYTITYRPLTMSTPEAPHSGTIFFPIPDGTALLYSLRGVADSPLPADTIQRQVAAKQAHVEVLRVTNWLPKPQRFTVVVDLPGAAAATRLTAPSHLDVPGLSHRDCRLQFVTYLEGVTGGTVTFRNEATGEFTFYRLTFTAAPPALQGTVQLTCPVRTLATHGLAIENPLPVPVTLAVACDSRQVTVPTSLVVAPSSTARLDIAFRPLLLGEAVASLKLTSKELGLFHWQLRLKGAPAGAEQGRSFSAALGGAETQVYHFRHWGADKAEYKCSFRSKGAAGFECRPTVAAPAAGPEGADVELEVTFEPTAVGEGFRDALLLSSPTGGDYECPMAGTCTPPKPQGPVDFVKGAAAISFKNIFTKQVEVFYSIDNPAFSVKPSEVIPAKKAVSIAVAYKEDASRPRTGKLTILCPGETPSPWVYYLRGGPV